jgi:hypothetical protein
LQPKISAQAANAVPQVKHSGEWLDIRETTATLSDLRDWRASSENPIPESNAGNSIPWRRLDRRIIQASVEHRLAIDLDEQDTRLVAWHSPIIEEGTAAPGQDVVRSPVDRRRRLLT